MFKFLKSKKGFTLVELMIVVVIMAILVAVAVPIYSAVTANAKKKTCIANMREIVAQINNYAMSNATNYDCSFDITGGTDAKAGTVGTITTASGKTGLTDAQVKGMFQVVPYCPAGGTYTVTVSSSGVGEEAGGVNVKVECKTNGTVTKDHVYGAAAETPETPETPEE